MARATFTDTWIRAVEPPQKGQRKFWDDRLPGFGLRVSQGGAKTFVLNRDKNFVTIGRFGVISLADARAEAKRLLAERTLGKVRPQSISFQTAKAEFIAEKEKSRRGRTIQNYHDRLRHFPFKGQLADITHHDVVNKLAKTPSNHEHDAALSIIKTFFTWCHNHRYVDDNPCRGISPRGSASRSRVLSDEELGKIWKACSWEPATRNNAASLSLEGEIVQLPRAFAAIVKLLILTGQRKGEISALRAEYCALSPRPSMSQQDVTTDDSVGSWTQCTITLPASLTKNKREHTFPIGAFSATLLSQAMPSSRPTNGPISSSTTASIGLLFPARGTSPPTPFNGFGKSKELLDKLSGTTDWTLHDLRRTFATRLADLGVAPHVIERLLNHISGTISGVAATYNRARYLPEMRQAVAAWETYLQRNVISA